MGYAVLMAIAMLAGWAGVGILSESFPRESRFGITTAGCAVVSTLLLLGYWWRVQRSQGFQARPRVSFREIMVLYFGLSVEVGLVVHTLTHSRYWGSDQLIPLASMFLPPALIVVIALIDDVPAGVRIKPRIRHRRHTLAADSTPQTHGQDAHATIASVVE